GIVERVKAETAPYLQSRLRELADHPLVGEVRGVGMLGAIELVQDKATRKRFPGEVGVGMVCRGHCFNNGLIMRAVGDTMIIAPPLVISQAEVDELVEIARKCLDLTLRDLTVCDVCVTDSCQRCHVLARLRQSTRGGMIRSACASSGISTQQQEL